MPYLRSKSSKRRFQTIKNGEIVQLDKRSVGARAQNVSSIGGGHPTEVPANSPTEQKPTSDFKVMESSAPKPSVSDAALISKPAATPQLDPAIRAELRQNITRAFDPSHPAQDREGFNGRNRLVAELLAGVLFRQNHAVICGPRGSGKTSLARVFCRLC